MFSVVLCTRTFRRRIVEHVFQCTCVDIYYPTKFKSSFTAFSYADVNYLRLDVVNFRKTLKVEAE